MKRRAFILQLALFFVYNSRVTCDLCPSAPDLFSNCLRENSFTECMSKELECLKTPGRQRRETPDDCKSLDFPTENRLVIANLCSSDRREAFQKLRCFKQRATKDTFKTVFSAFKKCFPPIKGKFLQFLCSSEKPDQYQCLKEKASGEMKNILTDCQRSVFPDATDDSVVKDICSTDKTEKLKQWKTCISRQYENKTMSKLWPAMMVCGGGGGKGQNFWKQACRNRASFSELMACASKEGSEQSMAAFRKCRKEAANDVSDQEFIQQACKSDDIKLKYLACIVEEKAQNNFSDGIPKKCWQALQKHRAVMHMHSYLCDNRTRYSCLIHKVSPEEKTSMKNCRQEAFSEVKEDGWVEYICGQQFQDIESKLTKWFECLSKEVLKKGKNRPNYLAECRGQSKNWFKDFVCEVGKEDRYTCLKRSAEDMTRRAMEDCQKSHYPDKDDSNVVTSLCDEGNQARKKAREWVKCLVEEGWESLEEIKKTILGQSCSMPPVEDPTIVSTEKQLVISDG